MSLSDTEFAKIEEAKRRLNQVSPTFCMVRWKHATINLATGATKSCCHHSYKSVDLTGNFSQLHDNVEEQQNRKLMLKGEKPKDCSYCWWIEESGHASDRQSWSAKSWMSPYLPSDKNELTQQAQAPSWLELNFSSACNLKCVYCSPIFSTSWYKEIRKHGPYGTAEPYNSIDHLNHVEFEDRYENAELLKKFWPWFHDILPGVRLLKITGGEPLLSEHTFKLLDLVKELCPKNLTLGINSNCSIKSGRWDRFVAKVVDLERSGSLNRFYLHPSLDTFGSRAEYIRSGLEMDLLVRNVSKFLEETDSPLHFICTLSNLALGGLEDFWRFVLDLKKKYFKSGREIAIGTEVLHSPSWMSLNILPESYVSYLDATIEFVEQNIDESGIGFYRTELEGLRKARSAFFTKPPGDLEKIRHDFSVYFSEVDRRRCQDFSQVFPELKDFLLKYLDPTEAN